MFSLLMNLFLIKLDVSIIKVFFRKMCYILDTFDDNYNIKTQLTCDYIQNIKRIHGYNFEHQKKYI